MVGLWDHDAHLKWAEGKTVRSYKEITDEKNEVTKKVRVAPRHSYSSCYICGSFSIHC